LKLIDSTSLHKTVIHNVAHKPKVATAQPEHDASLAANLGWADTAECLTVIWPATDVERHEQIVSVFCWAIRRLRDRRDQRDASGLP
jgi:hypothetical protein